MQGGDAYDGDAPTAPAPTSRRCSRGTASAHGFVATLPGSGGNHTVCAYGINRAAGANTLLGLPHRLVARSTDPAWPASTMQPCSVQIDLGCGNAKKEGYIGLDYVEMEQVDHVLDLTQDRYPFEDRSVDAVFSAHFLEHIEEPNHVFSEIGRIAKDGARIEFWTPYAFTNEAFLYGHLHFLTEEMWMHFCFSHRDVFLGMLGGRWQLNRIVYVIPPEVVRRDRGGGLLARLRDAVPEGCRGGVRGRDRVPRESGHSGRVPERVYATTRHGASANALVRGARR